MNSNDLNQEKLQKSFDRGIDYLEKSAKYLDLGSRLIGVADRELGDLIREKALKMLMGIYQDARKLQQSK